MVALGSYTTIPAIKVKPGMRLYDNDKGVIQFIGTVTGVYVSSTRRTVYIKMVSGHVMVAAKAWFWMEYRR